MKVLLIGSFSLDHKDNGGQPVKSRELYYAFCNLLGSQNVQIIETPGWKKHPFRLLHRFFHYAKTNDVIIMLPSHNGVFVFSRLLCLSKCLYKNSIFYDVIGGWLQESVSKSKSLTRYLSRFNGIMVETSSMKRELTLLGLDNVFVVPNFKKHKTLSYSDIENCRDWDAPFHLCTFSRVIKEKGIEDAIKAVTSINKECGRVVYTLDIYGEIYPPYKDSFFSLQKHFPEYISYQGMVDANQSVDVLVHYSALLFPTHYYTEGIPGTIIDAYSAGLPVITSLWKNYEDVFEDGKTGYGYEFGNEDGLKQSLYRFLKNKDQNRIMAERCIEFSKKFDPETNIALIMKIIQNTKEGMAT